MRIALKAVILTALVLMLTACAIPSGLVATPPPDPEIDDISTTPVIETPVLYVSLELGQRVQAIQLTTVWLRYDEQGEPLGSVRYSSPHPLQLNPQEWDRATLVLPYEQEHPLYGQFIGLDFVYSYPAQSRKPYSFSVTRWPVTYADGSQDILSAIDAGEAVEISGDFSALIPVSNGDYIYAVQVEWGVGNMTFAFRVSRSAYPEQADPADAPLLEVSTAAPQIALASDELLRGFEYIHRVNHIAAFDKFGDTAWDVDSGSMSGDNIAIWSDTPLSDFQLIGLGHWNCARRLNFYSSGSVHTVDELLPGSVFLLYSYYSVGTLPWSGISFLDETGRHRYFLLIQNQGDYGEPYLLIEFESLTEREAAQATEVAVPDSDITLRAYRVPWSLIAEYDALFGIMHDQPAGGETIAFWTDTMLRDFRFIEVGVNETSTGLSYLAARQTLHSVPELIPDMLFVVETSLGGGIPSRGIAFLDEHGIRRYFLLSLSGMDGSVELMPYPLDQRRPF